MSKCEVGLFFLCWKEECAWCGVVDCAVCFRACWYVLMCWYVLSSSLYAQLTYPECRSARALAPSLVGELLASRRKNLSRCCVCCVVCVVCVVWRGTLKTPACRFKTLPCVPAERPCHTRHGRFAGTHGDVLNLSTHGGVLNQHTHTNQTHTTHNADTLSQHRPNTHEHAQNGHTHGHNTTHRHTLHTHNTH